MAELIIESVPSGAEVQIDGEIVGTTPMTYPIDEGIGLAEFRAECLSGGAVSCDWNTLHARLINRDVSRFWWFLTESERRSIAEKAIKNTMFYQINYKGTGKPNCAGAEEFEDLRVGNKTCGNNAVIRYLKFAYTIPENLSSCYWKRSIDSDENCFVSNETYNLPCYMVSCAQPSPGFGHFLSAIQVAEGIDSLDNWIVFQYNGYDIKPGNWQMPYDTHIKISKPTKFQSCGGIRYSDTIAEFDI